MHIYKHIVLLHVMVGFLNTSEMAASPMCIYECVRSHSYVYMLRGKPVVRLHLPAAQQNSVLLRHTESVNNRLNHKGHPLLYFSSSSSTVIKQQ